MAKSHRLVGEPYPIPLGKIGKRFNYHYLKHRSLKALGREVKLGEALTREELFLMGFHFACNAVQVPRSFFRINS